MKDFWNDSMQKKPKLNRKKIIIITIAVFILVLIITVGILYTARADFRAWFDVHILQKEIEQNNVSQIEYNSDANVEICAYDKYIGILNKNKFEVYNSSGKQEANLDVPISNVMFDSSGRFLGIAENGGQNVYLISGQSVAWNNKIDGNISKICVNRNGYVAVAISGTSYKTIVSLYSPEGKELFKIYLSSTRVADLSISNDNKYLALAEIDTSSSVIKSNVKIISVENAQTDTDNSVAYVYNADNNKLLVNINYQEKNRLLCMYDDSIDEYYDGNNTELVKFADKNVSFATVKMNNDIAIAEEKSSGLFTADSEITLIDTENQKKSIYDVNDVTKEIYSKGNVLALNLGSELHFVDQNGWLIKKYVAQQEISNVCMSESIAGIVYRDKIDVISL